MFTNCFSATYSFGAIALLAVVLAVAFYVGYIKFKQLRLLFTPDPDEQEGFGRIVHIDDVMKCHELYKAQMKIHGFVPDPRTGVNLIVKDEQMITWHERFRGKELMRFLRKACRPRGPVGTGRPRTAVKMLLGMYTQEYLVKYAGGDMKKRNRIAIFLVTCDFDKNGNFIFRNDDDDKDAFDFGGLQP